MSALARALGYSDQRQLIRLINRRNKKAKEFEGKTFVVKLATNSPEAPEMVITRPGIIRASYLSDTARAVEFSDWADDVLFKVMTTGNYKDPKLPL